MARILIADDDPLVTRVLCTILQNAGHEVMTEVDGARALIAAHEKLPDVILLDIVMPIMDGLTALRLLKTHVRTCEIPVVIITGHDEVANVAGGYDFGADLLLGKPFEPEDVVTTIDRVIGGGDDEE